MVMYEMMCGRLPFYHRQHEQLFEAILTEEVKYPSRLSDVARSVLEGLLQKDPLRRLGGGSGDLRELKEHAFFNKHPSLPPPNWDDLLAKKIPPPYKPTVDSEVDVRNFDPEFTENENPDLTPPDRTDPISGKGEGVDFKGFTSDNK